MQVSRNGLLFIAAREAVVLVAYRDGEHNSIGLGHNDPKLRDGEKITVKRAFELFREDVAARETFVHKRLRVPVSQHAFDAMVSGYYQSGTDLLDDVVKQVNDINSPRWFGRIMETYARHDTNAAGAPMDGLAKRRSREACLHLTGEYGDLKTILIWHGDPKTTSPEVYRIKPGDV